MRLSLALHESALSKELLLALGLEQSRHRETLKGGLYSPTLAVQASQAGDLTNVCARTILSTLTWIEAAEGGGGVLGRPSS